MKKNAFLVYPRNLISGNFKDHFIFVSVSIVKQDYFRLFYIPFEIEIERYVGMNLKKLNRKAGLFWNVILFVQPETTELRSILE